MTGAPIVPRTVQAPYAPATALVAEPPGGWKLTVTRKPPAVPAETIAGSKADICVPPWSRA